MDNGNGGGFYRLPLCSHSLQQSLRSYCLDSQWIYAVFWRILPRNFPPPKWEIGGYLDRTKANKRNWILVWEDGFCDFARATATAGLQPDLFFKMSHEVYNYGEGLMGKISSENGHKWVQKNPSQTDNTPSWQNTIDPQPRTWEPQFKAGIQTITVIAVREGLVQLGSTQNIAEDLNFVALLQRKFNGLLAALSASAPSSPLGISRESKADGDRQAEQQLAQRNLERQVSWNGSLLSNNHTINSQAAIMPSMNSLQALLSKLPSVTSPPSTQINHITNRSTGSHSLNLSLPYQASPLLRSFSAPHGNVWLQEPANANPAAANVPVHTPALLPSEQQNFMANDSSNVNGEEYSYMCDLMGG